MNVGGGSVAVIKLEDLEIAFGKTFGEKGYSEDEIKEMADLVISLYGFDYAVVDNRLKPKERDVFYKLEEAGLVYTKQEEVTIKKGKVWRLHYWFLNRPKILHLSRGEEAPEKADEYAVYVEDDEIWVRKKETE
ncbi:MAG: hypothetical protein AYK23_03560 [Candidatus Proteinoplasmatales archaeon SG8-5]|nr:MAG: hypothetical protein AYK23_03560 [Candidatus Proteinoplasmatales archaeon SG8-5]